MESGGRRDEDRPGDDLAAAKKYFVRGQTISEQLGLPAASMQKFTLRLPIAY